MIIITVKNFFKILHRLLLKAWQFFLDVTFQNTTLKRQVGGQDSTFTSCIEIERQEFQLMVYTQSVADQH